MVKRRLSDAQIEAMIEGAPVEGAPEQLSGLIESLRARAAEAPTVPVSGALREFIVEGASTTAAASDTTSAPAGDSARPIRRLVTAASVLGVVPAYFVVGATMAAATVGVGGAHMLGVVDVPLLPDRGRTIVTPTPSDPEAPVPATTVVTPPSTASPTTAHEPADAGTSTSAPTRPTPGDPAVVPGNPGPLDPGPANSTPPSPTFGDAPAPSPPTPPSTVPASPPAPPVTTPAEAPATPPATPAATPPATPPTTAPPAPTAPETPAAPAPSGGEEVDDRDEGATSPEVGPSSSGAEQAGGSSPVPSENVGRGRTPDGG